MSPKTRTGLVAFAIVGGAFVVGGGVLALVLADRGAEPTETKGKEQRKAKPAGQPISTGDPKDDTAYILGHRWWVRPPTKDRLDQILETIIGTNQGAGFAIGGDGRLAMSTTRVGGQWYRFSPDNKDWAREVIIELDWSKRPDRKTVLAAIRDELDAAEYRDGPGR